MFGGMLHFTAAGESRVPHQSSGREWWRMYTLPLPRSPTNAFDFRNVRLCQRNENAGWMTTRAEVSRVARDSGAKQLLKTAGVVSVSYL